MKFTLSWLKTHLDTQAGLDAILEALTAVGLEVEGVVDPSAALAPFKIAHIIEANRHPNADRLQVCQVDIGGQVVEVVCGAPNARAGLKTVFAAIGTLIPRSGTVLKKSAIRGVESNGMLCSSNELALSDEHDGIMELPEDAPVGASFADTMGLADPVIEIAVTPNRSDALGIRGIARDLAAYGLGTLKPLDTSAIQGSYPSPISISIDPAAASGCSFFAGRWFRGVRNGPSPDWLRQRLEAIGLRPISALVDITNLMTIELNRPLHVFDGKLLQGNIAVRFGKPGEVVPALNGKDYTLDADMVAVCDDRGAISLGGIMGGSSTGVSDDTTDVFLEAALFDPLITARTGRKLGVHSDARFRFERGVDPEFVLPGIDMASRLILDLCGGEASELTSAGALPSWHRSIAFRPARCLSLGGVEVAADRCRAILSDLGFTLSDGIEQFDAIPPSWRPDIEGEADLVEEVLRIHGYQHIPTAPLERPTALSTPAVTPQQRRTSQLRRLLAGRGLTEAVTWSFMAKSDAERFGGGQPDLTLANPISSDLDQMRPTPLPNLIAAAGRNLARGLGDFGLSEVGPGYVNDSPTGQKTIAAGLRVGAAVSRHWRGGARPVDTFDAKADILAALAFLGVPMDAVQIVREAPDWYHPGQSGTLKQGPKIVLGHFGTLHPEVAARFDLTAPAAGFELFLDAVPLPKQKGRARPLLKPSPFQPLSRDFAFLVGREVAAETILKAAKSADKVLIGGVSLFDIYDGKGTPEGQKSVAIAVTLKPTDHTLTDAEIEAVSAAIVAAVTKATGGSLRG